MNLASFNISLKEVEKLLKELEFWRMNGIKSINSDGVSSEFIAICQQPEYFKIYKTAIRNFDFDYLLFDESFFQFSIEENKGNIEARYAFFQNPITFKSYEEYLDILRLDGIIDNQTDEEIGNFFQEEYEQFILEQQINLSSTAIRYDIDLGNYEPLIHSVSHIHIGNSTNVRIPCDKRMTPLKFVLFVIKHTYYRQWKNLILSENVSVFTALTNAKKNCELLDTHLWQDSEKLEFHLT